MQTRDSSSAIQSIATYGSQVVATGTYNYTANQGIQSVSGYPSPRTPLPRSGSAPAARTTATYEPSELKQSFQWDMMIPYSSGELYAVALLDPQAQTGNWITQELLRKLGMISLVQWSRRSTTVEAAMGPMSGVGKIGLQMKRRTGNKYYNIYFDVLPDRKSPGFELILGRPFLNQHDILSVNRDALLPLVASEKATPGKHKNVLKMQERSC